MPVRLSKIAREFNVGLSTIVEFLHQKGIKISSDPNAKLSEEDYALVAKEFSSDSEVKKESTMVDLKNTRKKKETVSIDDMGNIQEKNEEDEFISVKDEVKLENNINIKVIDRIDLNHPNKPVKEVQPQVQPQPIKEKEKVKEVEEEKQAPLPQPKLPEVPVKKAEIPTPPPAQEEKKEM